MPEIKIVNQKPKPQRKVETIIIEQPKTKTKKRLPRGKNAVFRRNVLGNGRKFISDKGGPEMTAKLDEMLTKKELTPTTAAGRAYVTVSLNPNGDKPIPYLEGVPDAGGTSSTLFAIKDAIVIDSKALLDITAEAQTYSFVSIATDNVVLTHLFLMTATNLPGAQFPTIEEITQMVNAKMNVDGIAENGMTTPIYPNWHRPKRKMNINTGALELIGTGIVFCWFRPENMSHFDPDGDIALDVALPGFSWIKDVRIVAKGLTSELNANALTNQGTLYATSVPSECALKTVNIFSGGTIKSAITATITELPDISISAMMNQDNNTYQALATEGCYQVTRLWGDSKYVSAMDARKQFYVNGNAGQNFKLPGNLDGYLDISDPSVGYQVLRYDNIHISSTIRLKMRAWYEFTLPGGSPYAGFLRTAPMEDASAIKLQKTLAAEMPHAMPAIYNDFGLLGGLVNSVLDSLPFGGLLKKGVSLIGGLLGGPQKSEQPTIQPMPIPQLPIMQQQAPFNMANMADMMRQMFNVGGGVQYGAYGFTR